MQSTYNTAETSATALLTKTIQTQQEGEEERLQPALEDLGI